MEEFEKIDWTPNIEDIVDNQFVSEDRLQNESAMYRILNGIFQDPFQDIRKSEKDKKQQGMNNEPKVIVKKPKGRSSGKKKKKSK